MGQEHAGVAGTTTFSSQFQEKIRAKTLCVGVLGLGYVGLPLAQAFCRAGVTVLGFDVDPEKIEKLRARKSYIKHIGEASIAEMLDSGLFSATTDLARLSEPVPS